MEQQTEEWLQARVGKATSSRFNDILTKIRNGEAAARRNYRAELVAERLTGQPADSYTSADMQWGIDNEDLARLNYELDTGNDVERVGFIDHKGVPQCGASPDGLVGVDGGLEIKCPKTATHIETLKTKQVPRQYVAQIQGGMWVTGRLWWDFVSFDPRLPENARYIRLRVNRDDEYISNLDAEVRKFLKEVDDEEQFIEGYEA